jgi:hypothetical protein
VVDRKRDGIGLICRHRGQRDVTLVRRCHLAKDGRGIDRSHRPDCLQINADIPLLGRCSRNRDLRRWARLGLFLAAENQVKRNRKEQQQHAPNEYPQHSTPCTALSRNALDVSGNLDPGNSAEFFSESM